MDRAGKSIVGPFLVLNLIMYIIVVGFASWCMNRFINDQTHHPAFGGNGATFFFLVFSMLAGVLGVASKLAGSNHVRAWRRDSLASAAAPATIAWSITALAMGLACKEINIGGYRGWNLKVLEAFIIILTFTELAYLAPLHAGGAGYRDPDDGVSGGAGHGGALDPGKGTTTGVV